MSFDFQFSGTLALSYGGNTHSLGAKTSKPIESKMGETGSKHLDMLPKSNTSTFKPLALRSTYSVSRRKHCVLVTSSEQAWQPPFPPDWFNN